MGASHRALRLSNILAPSLSKASRFGKSSGRSSVQNGLRLRRIPSAAWVELLSVTVALIRPLRTIVPSELTKYSFTALKRAEAVTDWTSEYWRYKFVTSCRVLPHELSSSLRAAIGPTAETTGARAKS